MGNIHMPKKEKTQTQTGRGGAYFSNHYQLRKMFTDPVNDRFS